MYRKTARRATALLLVLGLVVATAPVAASLDACVGEADGGSSLFASLKDWIAGLWLGPGPATAPATSGAPDGDEPGSGTGPPESAETDSDPTPQPQIGGDIDPNG